MRLNDHERAYYHRQMVLPGWGAAGQEKLKAARVLVVGAGGLGSPVLQYLGAAGVGTIGIVDYDFVELSNLHRQVIHRLDAIDTPKVASAADAIRASNPHVEVREYIVPVSASNAQDLVGDYDIVADCTDNFASRDAVHAACFALGRPLVSAAAQMTDGTLTTFRAYEPGDNPCFRCLYPTPLPPEMTPSCAQIGVAGPVVAVMGALQAMEVIKQILGVGPGLSGTMLIYEAWDCRFEHARLSRAPGCPLCARVNARDAAAYPPVTGG